MAGDGGSRTRTPLESKPEQESLLLRGRRSRREPPDRRRVEEGAARRVSVTEGPYRVRGCLPKSLCGGPGSFSPAAGPRPPPPHLSAPLTHSPLGTQALFPQPSRGSLPTGPCGVLPFFFSVSAVSWTLTHNPFRLWGLRCITHKPRREGLAEDDPPRLSETCRARPWPCSLRCGTTRRRRSTSLLGFPDFLWETSQLLARDSETHCLETPFSVFVSPTGSLHPHAALFRGLAFLSVFIPFSLPHRTTLCPYRSDF